MIGKLSKIVKKRLTPSTTVIGKNSPSYNADYTETLNKNVDYTVNVNIPQPTVPISKLSLLWNVRSLEPRKQIMLISSLPKQQSARRRGDLIPRAIFNRHQLFAYQGLYPVTRYVDRFWGDRDDIDGLSNEDSYLEFIERPGADISNVMKGDGDSLDTLDSVVNEPNETTGLVSESFSKLTKESYLSSQRENVPEYLKNKTASDWRNTNRYYSYSRLGSQGVRLEELRRNPTAENIVNYYGKHDGYNTDSSEQAPFPSVEYEYTDFALCKYYGSIANNQMVTLRRFPFPVQDNIFSYESNSIQDFGRLVTWMGEETGNKLSELMKMDWSFVWKELQSEMQTIKSGPASQSLTDSIFGSKVGKLARLTSVVNPAGTMFKNLTMNGADFYDFAQHDRMRIDGPVNSIDKITVRDRGLNFEQKFTLKFHYELNQIGGLNPRLLLLDMLANVLLVTFDRGNFWGGGIRYQADLRQQQDIAIGDTSKLLKGDYAGYVKSVGESFKSRFLKMSQGSPGNAGAQGLSSSIKNGLQGTILGDLLGPFADPIANIFGGIGGSLINNYFGNAALKSGAMSHVEIPNSLLTNQPVGNWHITIGNPFQPIAVYGNVILEKTTVELSDTLGFDDFPNGFTVTCELKHPIARDKDSIQSALNLGRGPMYIEPYVFNTNAIKKLVASTGQSNPYDPNYELSSQFLSNIYGMGKWVGTNATRGGSHLVDFIDNAIFGKTQPGQ